MNKKFYITTTLPYVNAEPHIGFALEIVQADVLARYHRLAGDEVFFNTGTDEHGQKIYQKALEAKKEPQAYVDEYAAKFDDLKKALSLSYNSFIRTTQPHHLRAAQKFWKKCLENGDIYKDKQKIRYCVGCELEKTDSELVDGQCPLHPNRKLEILKEENYFFRFSKYQKPLLKFYQNNPDFIIPRFRLKEITKFVRGGLKDFSISRLKKKLPWGVPVPNDPDQVMYVWFDALINYISAIGWLEKPKEFQKWWPGIQVAGKDNLRQQSAMWQAMLTSAGLPNSRQILIHGFVTAEGQKMSKSLGNVIDPFAVVKKYGTDATRYYLLREIPSFKDGDFSYSRFEQLYNADLANGLGNLIARVAKLCQTSEFKFPVSGLENKFYSGHKGSTSKFIEKYRFDQALAYIWAHLARLDKKIDQEKPWDKKGKVLEKILVQLVKEVRQITGALEPFLPATSRKIQKQFKGPEIKSEKSLFPRIR
jgi:methionyl-tRNA synthetase